MLCIYGLNFDEMNLYSWVVFWFKSTVRTSRIARVRTIYLMEKPSFEKPVCYSLCNGLQYKSENSVTKYLLAWILSGGCSVVGSRYGWMIWTWIQRLCSRNKILRKKKKNSAVSYCLGQQWRVT
jgi:hypothetical protein